MRNGLSEAEVDRVVEMISWAVSQNYRGLRWIIPNDGTVPGDMLVGVPVHRTGVDNALHLMGHRLLKPERTLCFLERSPDGPHIEGGPAEAEDCDPDQPLASVPAGVDWSRLPSPQFTLSLVGGLALVVGGTFPSPGAQSEVHFAAASTVLPESPGTGDDGQPWAPDTGGQWNPVFTQPSKLPDAPTSPPAPSDNLRQAIEYGEEWVAADVPPAEPVEDVAESVPEPELELGESDPVDEPEAPPEVTDGGFVPLPEPAPPVAPPPPPADAPPVPPEAEQIEDAAPTQPDPNDLREAAEHYREAAEHLDAAAAAIEAGNSAQSGGQGGSVTETEPPTDTADTTDDAADLDGAHVSIQIGGLDVVVDGEHHTVDVSVSGTVQVDADGNAVVVSDEGGVAASETSA